MAKRTVQVQKPQKPVLVQVGEGKYIDPTDVVGIIKVKPRLYVVRLRSNPNPDFPLWVRENHIENLLAAFDLKEVTVENEDYGDYR